MFDTRQMLENVQSSALIQLTEEEKKRLKELFLMMAEDIFSYCKKHNLTVMLGGGSVLGAVRHGGFIPWDDDIDLNMARKDYAYFAEHFEEEFGEKYEIYVPDGTHPATQLFMKVSLKGTMMEDMYTAGNPYHLGVAADIFPIEDVPLTKAGRKVKGFVSDLFAYSAVSCYLFQSRNPYAKTVYASSKKGKINYNLRLMLGALMSVRPYEWWYRKFDSFSGKLTGSSLCTIPTGRKHYQGEMCDKAVFFPVQEVFFEGRKLAMPADSNRYLTQLYGDYMKIPPVEKREKHFFTAVSLGE